MRLSARAVVSILAGIALGVSTTGASALSSRAATTPPLPFTQCPAVGSDTSCGVLLVINADLSVSKYDDPDQPPYDEFLYDGDDTLVGIQNDSEVTIPSITLEGPYIFAFQDDFDDGVYDGICGEDMYPYQAPECPNGPTGYEGPHTGFDIASQNEGIVNFLDGGLLPGASRYFGLENALTSAQIDSIARTPHNLTVTVSGNGKVTNPSAPWTIDCAPNCKFTFPFATFVPLAATPAAGSTFAGWSGDCTGMAPCAFTMLTDHAVTATFSRAGPPPPPPPPPTCSNYTIIDSRGSGEPANKFSPPGARFLAVWRTLKPGKTIETYTNPYVAPGWTSFAGAIIHRKHGAYWTSVEVGTHWVTSKVKALKAQCGPNGTKVILLGYSQGAQVTADAYQAGATQNVFAVVLFGDPLFNGADSSANRGGYSGGRHGVLGTRKKFSSGSVRILSYCHKLDPICQFPWPVLIAPHPALLLGDAAILVAWLKLHHDTYDKDPKNGAEAAAEALAGAR